MDCNSNPKAWDQELNDLTSWLSVITSLISHFSKSFLPHFVMKYSLVFPPSPCFDFLLISFPPSSLPPSAYVYIHCSSFPSFLHFFTLSGLLNFHCLPIKNSAVWKVILISGCASHLNFGNCSPNTRLNSPGCLKLPDKRTQLRHSSMLWYNAMVWYDFCTLHLNKWCNIIIARGRFISRYN